MRAGTAACLRGAQGIAVGGIPFCKKLVRAGRRAIFLRMSNRAVQFSFYDGAHLMLSPDGQVATFVDSAGRRAAVATQAALGAAAGTSALNDEIARRLVYAKGMISVLVNGSGTTK